MLYLQSKFTMPKVETVFGCEACIYGEKRGAQHTYRDGCSKPRPCKYGDPLCPCQDGDLCHYEGPNAWPPPKNPAD